MTGEGAVQFLEVRSAAAEAPVRRIAYRHVPAAHAGTPGLFWLSGFKSDMASTKATAVAGYARMHGLGSTVFDYSGHGLSSGRFEDGTIGQWLDEACSVFRKVTHGPQVVIGSSMGGHIALLLLRKLLSEFPDDGRRLAALVLIAPAWNMTEDLIWKGMGDDARRDVVEKGVAMRPSDYGEPYAITRSLIEDGRRHLLARRPFDAGRPVLILQGAQDPDVPLRHTEELMGYLTGGHAELVVVPDGEHRLSRPEDLARLYELIDRAVAAAWRGQVPPV